MATLDLNSYKMNLLREIIDGFNDEAALRKLDAACRLIRNGEEQAALPIMPAQLLQRLMDTAAKQDAEGLCIASQELEEEMLSW